MLLAAPFEFLGGHVTPVSQDFVCDLNFSGQCFPPYFASCDMLYALVCVPMAQSTEQLLHPPQ
jgi:hypothetical protein